MHTAVLEEYEEPLAIREVDRPEPDPTAVVTGHVAPEDVDRELEATTAPEPGRSRSSRSSPDRPWI